MASQRSLEPTSIVSLVVQSKKALQDGESLCSRAHALSTSSAQTAFDLLALEAKVKWTTDAVIEQLKLAGEVAKSIQHKRATLDAQVEEWDLQRTQRTQALDAMLDVLSTQVVPPDFHQPRVEDDVFGPPEADDDPFMTGEQSMNGHVNGSSEDDALSSPATIRGELPPLVSQNMSRMDIRRRQRQDRTRWKTLRDFVDERGIEDALEKMEVERSSLEDLLLSTSDFPGTIEAAIFSIREGVPVGPSKAQPLVQEVIEQQESASAAMATHLESLAVHFDQVEAVLRDNEAGEIIGEEDIEEMARDVDHLPSIIYELEQGMRNIDIEHQRLVTATDETSALLAGQRRTLDDLHALGYLMSEMLDRQAYVETETEPRLLGLHDYLSNLEALQTRFAAYQFSYSRLLLELGRRTQYVEAANKIVRGMNAQLAAMVQEERTLRESFKVEHGDHLPDDLCLAVENLPTRWEVFPMSWTSKLNVVAKFSSANGQANGHHHHSDASEPEEVETVPDVDEDLLADARDRVAGGDGGLLASLASI